jgi:predicted ATPase
MKESIKIKNLGPLKEICISEIKPFTVLIGESGSGKSTLMKVIALFRWIYKMQNIRSYLKHSNISKSPFRFRMETYLQNCGFEQFIKDDTQIEYTANISSNEYKIIYKDKQLNVLEQKKDTISIEDIYFNKISFMSETRNIISQWANKGSSIPGAYLSFYFHEIYNDFNLACENIRELNLSFLNLFFKAKSTQSGKKYLIQSMQDNFEIDYKNSSSGIQNAAPIMLIAEYFSKHFDFGKAFNRSVLDYVSNTDKLTDFKPVGNVESINKKIYIHIEEPELSLYPDAQCDLINDLIDKCFINNKHTIELFLATHSPYIINHLNLLIKAYEENKLIDGKAKFNYDDLTVYQVADGRVTDLKIQNQKLIDTNPLSETINYIYERYEEL